MYKREDEYILNMRMPKELIDKMKKIAERNRISLSAQIRVALSRFIDIENGDF